MWRGKRLTIILLLVAIVTGAQASLPTEGRAQEVQLPFSTGGFGQGMVTAIHDASIDIDNRNYSFKPNVMIVNEQGQPIEMSSVLQDSEVKFHLKEGQIDKMVVILPR